MDRPEFRCIKPRSGSSNQICDRAHVRFFLRVQYLMSSCTFSDPRNGEALSGSDVLDYLVSPAGSLGIVKSEDDAMAWRKALENFLFPDAVESEIPKGSKFFVGTWR